MYKKIIFLIFLSCALNTRAKCHRSDYAHATENIMRCTYHQEDIYRCYTKKTGVYKECERRKECFFCGCPIEEHSKQKVKKPKKQKKGTRQA